jgi:hypothetical protein
MRHLKKRATFGLGILGLAAAATAAAVLAFASGGNAASSNTCTQVVPVGAQQPPNANCLFVAVVPSVLSANRTGLLIVRFKNIFANATATHTVLKAILPSGASIVANPPGVTASTNNATCSQQTVSCSFGSVPGGSIVSMYVQFTIVPQDNPPAQLDPVKGFVSFDESNGNTGTTTNDSFETDSGSTQIVASISGTTGGDQGGLCSNTAFVFFPVLAGNAAAVLTLNYPTIPSFVKSWKQTPLFEFLPDKNGVLTLVQLVTCGVKPNPSPDSCLLGDPQKFGASGVSFTVSVSGSDLDGRFSP